LHGEPSVASEAAKEKPSRRSFWKDLSNTQISDRPAVDFRASAIRGSSAAPTAAS